MGYVGAFETGTASNFSGADGVLQKLLDFVCGTKMEDQAMAGSGNGPYTATLTTPVNPGSPVINYTIGTTPYTAEDDGVGNFSGDFIDSGSVDHDTGDLTITFTSEPASSPLFDYVYGEHGQDWELKYQRNTRNNYINSPTEPFGSDLFECILHNNGLSGSENVLIGFREWRRTATDSFGWDLTGYLTYTDQMRWGTSLTDMGEYSYDATPEHYSTCPNIVFLNNDMTYWFYSNRQRIIVCIEGDGVYESCYLGFANRFGNPTDYPYPLVIKGSIYGGSIAIHNAYSASHAFLPYAVNSNWYLLHNVLPNNSWSTNWTTGERTFMLPWTYWVSPGILYEAPAQKEVLMTPVTGILDDATTLNSTLWELDGVYHLAASQLQSEDFVRGNDGIKYRVFQNITNVAYQHYMGVGELDYTSTTTSSTSSTSSTTTTNTA